MRMKMTQGRDTHPSHSSIQETYDALVLDAQLRQSLVSVRSLGSRNLRVAAQEPNYLVAHTPVSEVTIEGRTYHLNKSRERKALVQAIDARIRFASSVHEREAYLREVRQLLEVSYAVTPEEKSNLPFTWAEVEAMKKCEWISFGAHTMHHPLLAYLTDPSESEYEVCQCRTELERHLKSSVRSFAYPVGKLGDIGEQAVRGVQKSGYSWAVTTIGGINTPQSNPYLLHRFGVNAQDHWLIIAANASGVWDIFRTPIRFILRLPR